MPILIQQTVDNSFTLWLDEDTHLGRYPSFEDALYAYEEWINNSLGQNSLLEVSSSTLC